MPMLLAHFLKKWQVLWMTVVALAVLYALGVRVCWGSHCNVFATGEAKQGSDSSRVLSSSGSTGGRGRDHDPDAYVNDANDDPEEDDWESEEGEDNTDAGASEQRPAHVASSVYHSAAADALWPLQNTEFLGRCFCDPRRRGRRCQHVKTEPWNPWVPNKRCVGYDFNQYAFKDPGCTLLQSDNQNAACQYFCFFSPDQGIARINRAFWEWCHLDEAKVWKGGQPGSSDHAGEMSDGFRRFKDVPLRLGHVLETGCGPFTQTKFMMIKMGLEKVQVDSVTLTDPNLHRYMKEVPGCTYRNGKLLNFKTRLLSVPTEELKFEHEFDTVVMMNVVEHTYNVFEVLRKLYRALKPGGVMILFERVYDGFWRALDPRGNNIEMGGLHPIRMKRAVLDTLFRQFERPFLLFHQQNQKRALWRARMNREHNISAAAEEPVWFIGRKTRDGLRANHTGACAVP